MLPLAPIRPEATRALTPSLIPQVVAGGGSSMGGGGQGRNRSWRDESSHGKGYGGARYSDGHPDRRHDSIRYSRGRHHHPYAGASRRDHWQHDDTRRDAVRPAPPSMGNYDGSRGYDRGMSAPRSPANGTPHEVPPPFPSAREVDADEEQSLQQPAASMVASATYSNDSDEDDLDVEQAVGKLRDLLVKLIPFFLKEQEKSSARILCPFTMRGLAHMVRSGHVSQSTYRAMARHFEWPRDPLATLQPQKVKCHAKPMRDLRALHMHAYKCPRSIEVTELLEDDETSGNQLCHRVLDEILGPDSSCSRPDVSASYSARKPQEFSETMSWPPVLVLEECTRDLSSGTLLKAKYSDLGETHFFNEYDGGRFTGKDESTRIRTLHDLFLKEYEQKFRINDQLLQDANIQYEEKLARLKEEKDKANLEAELIKQGAEDAKEEAVYEALARLESTRVRPLNDMFLKVQGRLFRDFSAELEKGHFIRSVGLLDLGYMLHLGLSESDYCAATMWMDNFRNVNPEAESESGLPLFEPLKIFPVYVDPETGSSSYQVKEDHPFVVAFRKRYDKRKNPLTQRTRADEMLEYMRVTFSEFQNSTHPVSGYQRVITNCCQLVQCYEEGRCSGIFPKGTFLSPRLYRDDPNAFCHPVHRVECSPEQHADLLEQLEQA